MSYQLKAYKDILLQKILTKNENIWLIIKFIFVIYF